MAARLVPSGHLERATGLLQGTAQTMTMLGYIVGGVLVATVGRAQAIMLDGISFLLFAGLLLLVRFPARNTRNEVKSVWQTFKQGLSYVRGSAVLLGLPVVALLLNASFAPIEMLLPGRMLELGAGEQGFGLFSGLLLGGMAAGSLLTAALGPRLRAEAASVWGMAGAGLWTLALAFTATAAQMYVLAALLGLTVAVCNFGVGIIFQRRVDPAYFGRVGSLLGKVSTAGAPPTLLAPAPVADSLSLGTVFAVSGAFSLCGAAVWAALLRREPS